MSIIVKRDSKGNVTVTKTGKDAGGGSPSTRTISRQEAKGLSTRKIAREEKVNSLKKEAAAQELVAQAKAAEIAAVQARSRDIQSRGGYYDFGTGKFVPKRGKEDVVRNVVSSGSVNRDRVVLPRDLEINRTNRAPIQETKTIEPQVKVAMPRRQSVLVEDTSKKSRNPVDVLRSFASRQEQKALREGVSAPVQRAGAAFASVVAGTISLFAKPRETFLGAATMIAEPRQSGEAFRAQFTTQPYSTTGEVAGGFIGGKALGRVGGLIAKTVSKSRLKPSVGKYSIPPRETQTTFMPVERVIDVVKGKPKIVVETIPFKRKAPGFEVSRNLLETATKERQLLLKGGGRDPYVNRGSSTPLDDVITPMQRAQRQPGQSRLPEFGVDNPLAPETRYLLRYQDSKVRQLSAGESQTILGDFRPRVTESGLVVNIPKPKLVPLGKKGSSSLLGSSRTSFRSPNDYFSIKIPKVPTGGIKRVGSALTKGSSRVPIPELLLGAASTMIPSDRSKPSESYANVQGPGVVVGGRTVYKGVSDVKPVNTYEGLEDVIGQGKGSGDLFKLGKGGKTGTGTDVGLVGKTGTDQGLVMTNFFGTEKVSDTKMSSENIRNFKIRNPVVPKKPRLRFDDEEEKRRKKRSKKGLPRSGGSSFSVFVKSKGRERLIGTGLSREAALDLGASRAKAGLEATFKIKKTRGQARIKRGSGAFARSKGEFRSYKTVNGRRVPLVDTFIQKRSYRLGTRKETSAIQSAKRAKQRFL